MGRPRLEIGVPGKIRLTMLPGLDGSVTRWEAAANFRDCSGRTRLMRRTRATQKEAIKALTEGIDVASEQFSGIPLKGASVTIAHSRSFSPIPAGHHTLYRFFSEDGDLLYVGISLHMINRLASHRSGKRWWATVRNITLDHHPNYESARLAEKIAIRDEAPRYNLADLPRLPLKERIRLERSQNP